MSFIKLMVLFCTTLFISTTPVIAKIGTESGGGGDASEARVNEIRSDILKWIKNDGAKELVFSNEISYEEYYSKMVYVLQPKKVIISFTEEKVIYDNFEKTCKSFVLEQENHMHILCNISRFEKTSDSNQYKLIHHEYAGLVRVEKNDGAASDYKFSSQLTDYLAYETVLKLAVKKVKKAACTVYAKDEDQFYLGSYKLIKLLNKKKYKATSIEEAQYSIEKLAFSCTGSSLPNNFSSENDSSLFYCDNMYAVLTLKDKVSGEEVNHFGAFIKTRDIKPTQARALSNLIENIPVCKK